MAKIKWLPEAQEDIERSHALLKHKDIGAAARVASCILQGARLLKNSPHIGLPMPDTEGRRELFIAFGAGAYVLRYKIESNEVVVIVRVWHSRENRNID